MKNIKRLGLTAFAVLALTLGSCNSEDGGGGSLPSGTYIKAKVNGVQFKTLEIQGQSLATAVQTGTGIGNLITIQGSGDMTASSTMVINLFGITEPGTYTVGSDGDSVLAYVETSSSNSYDTSSDCSGAGGTVTITKISATKIEGTFSFIGKDDDNCGGTAKTVTEGSFRGVFIN